MTADLFDSLDDAKRDRLRARGWHEADGLFFGRTMWRRPGGACFDEEEAFRQLERLEAEEKQAEE